MAVLFRGALKRGRDSFYPALEGGCLMALLIRGFAGARIFEHAVWIVAGSDGRIGAVSFQTVSLQSSSV
jgi:hypothetical protein